MKDQSTADKQYGGLDSFRLAAAMLVAAIHTSPLACVSESADYFLTGILARIAVPFFFMVTGQFVIADLLSPENASAGHQTTSYLKKVCMLYGIAILIYIPAGLYAGHYQNLSFYDVVRMLFFDGSFYHLWYFPACITGTLLIYFLSRFMRPRALAITAVILYLFGLLGDSYYGLIMDKPFFGALYSYIFGLFSYTRNGIFMAPIFLLLGAQAGKTMKTCAPRKLLTGLLLSFLLMTAEGLVLHKLHIPRHNSMYFLLVPVMFFLYQLLLCWNTPSRGTFRTISTWIYILHPAMIIVVRMTGKVLHLTSLLVENSLIHYIAVLSLSFVSACLLCKHKKHWPHKEYQKDRAWIELDKNALAQNVRFLKERLPENCTLMPAVKANAYGHGAILISKELNVLDIRAFCVASVMEGVELRKNKIKGEILILGYTHPKQFALLHRYHLSQTVVDYQYALCLNGYGRKIHVHIGIDTGMHRLGEPAENLEHICEMFELPNLIIDGMFTHLSADDTLKPEDREFTRQQAETFRQLTDTLMAKGYELPKTHMQSSYGVLNYPELAGSYARVGIALYGVLSTKEDTDCWSEKLFPVLSLKTRIVSVRSLHKGDTAGYGMDFTAEHEMQIAALSIGYGDGLPRSLSNGKGRVLINGRPAPIIGRICMDQTIVDISGIPDAKAGDTAVIIGSSKGASISCADLAAEADTITNEILSRLGGRLTRIIPQ